MKKSALWVGVAVAFVLGGLIIYGMRAGSSDAPVPPGDGSVAPIPPAGAITISGKVTCLPHRNQGGAQTMECAYGLLGEDGHYYALRDSDPTYTNIFMAPMDVPVEVKGSFTAEQDMNYKGVGTITVTSLLKK